jgi:hypothetical protein
MSLTAAPLRLSTTDPAFEAAFKARLHWSADTDAAIEQPRGRHPGRLCATVAMRPCWTTPSGSTACRPPRWPSWS